MKQLCPMCNGKGIVPQSFYDAPSLTESTTTDLWVTCKACDGRGVI
jgi:DnaJ-class molecular chaperone